MAAANAPKKVHKNKQADGPAINISEILHAVISKWYWFVISLTITVCYSLYSTARIENLYTRHTEILIKSTPKGTSIDEQMETFANMGFKSSTNTYNEIYTFKSPETTIETARRLKLYIEYSQAGQFHSTTLYGTKIPVLADFCDLDIQGTSGFDIEISPDSTFRMYNFTGDTITGQRTVEGKLQADAPTFVATPAGTIALTPNERCKIRKQTTYTVKHIGLNNATAKHIGKLQYTQNVDDKNMITISINDNSIERADDILKTIVEVYNENWIKDKNRTAKETQEFINTRLSYVSDDLDQIESSISSFKSDNLLPDLEAQAEIQMRRERELTKLITSTGNELEKSEYFLKNTLDKKRTHTLLPINSGINNQNINTQISAFNALMIERNNLADKSSVENPAVKDMDIMLSSMLNAIISSTRTHIKGITTKLESLEKEREILESELAKNPTHTTFLASAEREQSVKEKIYLFLLQKREENQLSQEFTPNRTRVLTPPSGSYEPTAPQKNRSLILAIIIGLAVPVALIIIKEATNTKVRGRKDLENTAIPIIGEIPLYGTKKTSLLGKILAKFSKKEKEKNKLSNVVVKGGSRNAINEAFRILRTNIEFITRSKEQNTIIFTSFNPGSGKTFCILNTAISVAIKGEKVLLIDGDMRHASLSNYVNNTEVGLSNYLAKEINTMEEAITISKDYENLHIIPTGTIPPNPTELLESERFTALLHEAKKKYKYIFIDCPPVDIVADTHIIEKEATNSIFIVRCNLMQRAMLIELENIYTSGKLRNMSLILNAINMKAGRYGYKYGYNNGYSYSYGPKKSKKK